MPSRYNLNRLRKTYPTTRRTPVIIGVDTVESAVLTFTAASSATYTFTSIYVAAPTVTATPASSQNVNVYITAVTTTYVTITTSAPITGDIHLQVAKVD
jgi:copper(I)-binding protein